MGWVVWKRRMALNFIRKYNEKFRIVFRIDHTLKFPTAQIRKLRKVSLITFLTLRLNTVVDRAFAD